MTDKLERASTVAVLVAAVLVSALATSRLFTWSRHQVVVGRHIELPPKFDRTRLAVALSSSCGHCAAGRPFYARLLAERDPGVTVVALFDTSDPAATAFLADMGLKDWPMTFVSFERMGIRATPSILLLDGGSRVVRTWVGRLDASGEEAVLDSVRSGSRKGGTE